MGTVQGITFLPQARAAAAPPTDYYEEALQRELQRLDEIRKRGPTYTPEQVQQRRDENQREYEVGLLGMLSGQENLAGAGGVILKNAIANRTPKVTEKGTMDPLSGEMTYDTDYLQQQSENRVSVLQQARALSEERKQRAREHDQTLRALKASTPSSEPLVQVVGEDGEAQYVPRSQAVGMKPPPKAPKEPTEGERKAATLLARMEFSVKQLKKAVEENPEAAVGTALSEGLSHVPVAGGMLATQTQSAARQRVENAQLDILDAALTLSTGAAYTREQLKGHAKSYFPQPGEKDPQVLRDKQERLDNVINAARIAAGRAGQPTAPAKPAPNAPPTPTAPGGMPTSDEIRRRALGG